MTAAEVLEGIKRNTQALLGEDRDLGYITESLLADMEQNGVEVSLESAFGGESEQAYYGCRIVDAIKWVAFQTSSGSVLRGRCEHVVTWLEKPVEIVRSGSCEDGKERYAIRKLRPA